MSIFTEEWTRKLAAAELEPLHLDLSQLQAFPEMPGWEQHFVVGADKRGVLWSLESGFVDGAEKRVMVAVRYHAPAVHVNGIVHGGAISAIIDAFAATCGVLQLGWNMRAATKEQVVRFKRPLRLETTYLLVARSKASSNDGRSADVNTVIWDEDGQPRIEADTVMVIPQRA